MPRQYECRANTEFPLKINIVREIKNEFEKWRAIRANLGWRACMSGVLAWVAWVAC